jgi:general secretion pathway protein J
VNAFSRTNSRGVPRPRGQGGFTLLEVLLATALLAMALALAFGALRAAVGAVRSGEALIERTDEVRVAQEFLRRQFSHAMPLAFEEMEDNGERKLFEADAEFVRFVAPMPGYLSRGGPHVQWLQVSRERDGYALSFDHAQLNGYDPEMPKPEDARPPVLLLEGMADARFEYRALDETGELGEWTDAWDDPQQMPMMVRLLVEFEREDGRMWPTLEVPLRLAAAAGQGFRGTRLRSRQPGNRRGNRQ